MTRLTLIMPLKGRRLHTMRFFWHANRQRLPYRIIVCDGQVEPGIADRLSLPHALFPALDIDYMRCPDDVSYQQYFDKMAAAADRVTTPYAMLCDNDDFIVRSGVDACVAFLDTNPGYAGISGGVAGFSLHRARALPDVAGAIQSLGSMYHDGYAAADYDAPSVAKRVRRNFARGYSLYYSVFRTEVLATVLKEIAALGFTDLKAVETFFGARVKSLGKCRLDRRVASYMRQRGTSGGAPDVWTLDDVRGSGARAAEVGRCLAVLEQSIATADSSDDSESAASLREMFVDKMKAEAASKAKVPPPNWRDGLRKVIRAIVPRGALGLRRHVLRRRARDEFVASMQRHRATQADMALIQCELRDIEETLEGPAFPAFMRNSAADLLAASAKA